MNEDHDYRSAISLGLRRAGLHWLRAGYEVVAGLGALLEEVNSARKPEAAPDEEGVEPKGPVRIELD